MRKGKLNVNTLGHWVTRIKRTDAAAAADRLKRRRKMTRGTQSSFVPVVLPDTPQPIEMQERLLAEVTWIDEMVLRVYEGVDPQLLDILLERLVGK